VKDMFAHGLLLRGRVVTTSPAGDAGWPMFEFGGNASKKYGPTGTGVKPRPSETSPSHDRIDAAYTFRIEVAKKNR
jgi:hypothetical protein